MIERDATLEDLASGQWHIPASPHLGPHAEAAAHLCEEYNATSRFARSEQAQIQQRLLGTAPSCLRLLPPVFFDYGVHTHIGKDVFINAGLTVLDTAEVVIGDRTLLGPNCQLITVGHPVDNIELRRQGWEKGQPIRIGEDCWLGAGVIVLPGVTIGDRCTVGAGAVVTRDIPADSIAVGNPARVMRQRDAEKSTPE